MVLFLSLKKSLKECPAKKITGGGTPATQNQR